MLEGKNILVGVTASIAAYKAAIFVRLLVKAGANVRVVMTSSAKEFITPLTLATLSKQPVLSSFTDGDQGEWNNHVELGLWADAMIIAPASANTIGKMANGICDNLLLATYLSARCPVFVAPTMDLDMYQHPSVRSAIDRLASFGNHIIDAEDGELASGLSGVGRLAEPKHLMEALDQFFNSKKKLKGKRVLITAGPTYEAIDPVRFIGNHSTGKMGYALAEAARNEGAEVTLVSGPSFLTPPQGVLFQRVTSGQEMYAAAKNFYEKADIAIFAAAVADYTPKDVAEQKIKKAGEHLNIELVPSVDIALGLGQLKQKHQLHVGFALETENEIAHAQAKIKKKNFDMIVLNSLKNVGAGFGHETNKITIIDKANNLNEFELKSKKEVAQDIIDAICEKL